MARNAMLIFLALLTDATQAFLTAGLMGLGGVVSAGTLGFGAPVAVPTAVALSFTVEVVTSLTFGAGLLLLLAYNNMFYSSYALGGSITELIPGIDVLPGWTIMTVLCIVQKSREEGGLVGSIAGTALNLIAPEATVAAGAVRTVTAPPNNSVQAAATPQQRSQETESGAKRVASDLKSIDGVRQSKAYAA